MKKKIIYQIFLIFCVIFLVHTVFAYETYEISSDDLEEGYTQELSPGDRVNFPIDGETGFVSINSVLVNAAQITVFRQNGMEFFYTEEHPDSDLVPNERKFEITGDNYYDIKVKLNSAVINEDQTRVASITIEETDDEVPEGTNINYACWRFHECSDGSRVQSCSYQDDGNCICNSYPEELCSSQNEEEDCEEYYTCEDGSEVQYCDIINQYDENGDTTSEGCICNPNPEELCNPLDSIEDEDNEDTQSNDENKQITCEGCTLNDKCVQIGYRTEDSYCGLGGLKDQLNTDETCNNNFECSSNLCVNSKCISGNLWQKFINWLGKIF